VLENILLPAIYHHRIPALDIADRVYRVFASCEVDQAQVDSLCARSVENLTALERRLVALVRSVLMQPALLLFERLFEGLTAQDMERAASFGAHYRSVVRDGTLIYCDLAGIACPNVAPDLQVEAA
jgi:ABC-type branched-subunit amino acid transport system ATPase component